MRVNITGDAKCLSRNEVRTATHFFSRQLFTVNSLKNAEKVDIHFVVGLKDRENNLGDATFLDRAWKPKKYRIRLDSNLSKSMLLRVLAHEMTHVHQWAIGRMVDLKNGTVRYNNKDHSALFVQRKKKVWQLPWEKDAIESENRLLASYRFWLRSNRL